MNQYSKSNLIVVLLLVVSGLFGGCQKVDPQFGNGMIPPEWALTTDIDTVYGMQSWIKPVDSLPIIRLEKAANISSSQFALGSVVDSYVGRIDAQVFTNFTPNYEFVKDGQYFGPNPTIDSVKLLLYFDNAYMGDTVTGVDIEVYEVIGGKFDYNKEYNNDFDITPYLASEPLKTFKVNSPEMMDIHLPVSYAEQFVVDTNVPDHPYKHDTLFIDKFKGLYFKAKQVQDGGCMYGFELSLSKMEVYYRGNTSESDTLTKTAPFDFYGISLYGSTTPYNTCLSFSQHDYSMANAQRGAIDPTQIGDSLIHTEFCYISSLSGLSTVIEIPDETLTVIRDKVEASGYKDVAVHSAILDFELADKSATNMTYSYETIAPYYEMRTMSFAPDYQPVKFVGLEAPLAKGTSLKRSTGMYKMDITSYMQGRMKGEIEASQKLEIAPSFDKIFKGSRSVLLGTGSETPPKLIITYTMVR